MPKQIEEPDYVIPVRKIASVQLPADEVCGLMFEDTSGQRYLLPIPGREFLGLAGQILQDGATWPDLKNWESKPPGQR